MKDVNAIIIQAGGLGSRMGNYTHNKPKCLIPYNGRTILENNLNIFNGKKIIVICDHLSDVLINYTKNILKKNNVIFVSSSDKKTTTSGLHKALSHINDNEKFILIWSDLFLKECPSFEIKNDIVIGLTDEFKCRWKYENGNVIKTDTNTDGILGFFAFKNKHIISDFSEDISLVGGNLTKVNNTHFQIEKIKNVIEIGDVNKYEELIRESSKSRFFNNLQINQDTVIKECIDSGYKNLIGDEIEWYKYLNNKVDFIPELISEKPFTMSRINGSHVFDLNLNKNEKTKLLDGVFNNINTLHSLGESNSDINDVKEIYINKTIKRVNDVHHVIPFFKDDCIKINNINYLNPFSNNNESIFHETLSRVSVERYHVIHGDITFSNLLYDGKKVYFIDPRGYFGNSKIYGDKNYDWSKLYYSVNGNYDSINQKKFQVTLNSNDVIINIKSNGFEDFSENVIQESSMDKSYMELIHSLIWLSLTGYVKEDIDSILYSFYKGVITWNLSLK